jgi:hypothetical protein
MLTAPLPRGSCQQIRCCMNSTRPWCCHGARPEGALLMHEPALHEPAVPVHRATFIGVWMPCHSCVLTRGRPFRHLSTNELLAGSCTIEQVAMAIGGSTAAAPAADVLLPPNLWIGTSPMNTPLRSAFAAFTLADGRALTVGGIVTVFTHLGRLGAAHVQCAAT